MKIETQTSLAIFLTPEEEKELGKIKDNLSFRSKTNLKLSI